MENTAERQKVQKKKEEKKEFVQETETNEIPPQLKENKPWVY